MHSLNKYFPKFFRIGQSQEGWIGGVSKNWIGPGEAAFYIFSKLERVSGGKGRWTGEREKPEATPGASGTHSEGSPRAATWHRQFRPLGTEPSPQPQPGGGRFGKERWTQGQTEKSASRPPEQAEERRWRQSCQKESNRFEDSSVYRTVWVMFRWPR